MLNAILDCLRGSILYLLYYTLCAHWHSLVCYFQGFVTTLVSSFALLIGRFGMVFECITNRFQMGCK